ncbi:hypothetical protein Tco_0720924 [Tanacetum coccineum]
MHITSSHTKKIFGNMRRVGKGFSGRETPLFPTMMVQAQEEMGEEQDRGNTNKTQSKATPNEPSSLGTSSGGGPRRQETMGDTIAQTRFENVSKTSNDPLLARVIDMEKTKTSQAQEITSLKLRVKKLEKKGGLRTHKLKRLYKVGLSRRVESSDKEGINLVSTHFDADTNMFGVHDLVGDEVVFESEVTIKVASTIPVSAATTTTTVITDDEITLAKALAELKSAKLPTITAATTITAASTRPKAKGKGKMVEPEPVKKLSKKDQLMLDKELAFKLQAEEEEEERLAKEKAQQIKEVNIAWDDVQARVKADYQTELVEESSKKAKAEIAQESSSKRHPPVDLKLFNEKLEILKKNIMFRGRIVGLTDSS